MPSATVHQRAVEAARRGIDKHGRDMTLMSFDLSGPSWDQTRTAVETPAVGLQTRFKAHEIDGDRVRATDGRYLVDSSVEPTTSMRLKDGDTEFSIVDVDVLKPGTTLILSRVQVRI